MARYWNKDTSNEALPGKDFDVENMPVNIVELPEDHAAWTVCPDGAQVAVVDGLPVVQMMPAETLGQKKTCKLMSLNSTYVDAMELILAPYPQAERDTFPEQAHEATEYQKVVDAAGTPVDDDYPMLKNIANGKGITTSSQKDTVLAKRAAMNVFCGAVTGKRHSIADAIENAADETALAAIDVSEVYTFAQGLLA